jgi:threonine 3-dehydrogenase
MKALVKAKPERGIWMQDIPKPEVGHNDVLIRVNRSAICGTDIHIYQWDDWAQHTIPVPLAVGHEFSGTIVECGIEVRGFEPGDRVSAEGHITCGVCRNCRAGRRHLCMNTKGIGVNRPGAFAEYIAVPAFNVFKLPDVITDDMAAILDRRRTSRRHYRHQRLSAGSRAKDGCLSRTQRDAGFYRRHHAGARHGRRIRCWYGDVGQPDRVP